ncbi:hypothetical protein PTTG_03668 [Puccinia triticina 1-1 BBBD Race 1]|uniref:Uncharacterized protein n=2 Tax=Puccinia triticina TaxID=208348 RepID=A0A0C4ES94_PUCT1|nr:uncharacterized protein PtA15_12A577 [Puccinia triticina]OAV93572.1 hypothetical protein PTTG_03668 [Puccinia triticina 1-1 BBBD Race 1]WAQ90587.1 hypothetical protein PtA15_12A577 [Puccinia triticina]WAR61899.1 hypothetical protein PtB15_12B591 [Puccinia triticina]
MIAIKQTTTTTELSPHEQQLKRKHLQDSSQLATKHAFPSLSTYFTLISQQQQQPATSQTTTDHHDHQRRQFALERLRWCDQCLASCSVTVKMNTHQVLIRCQRPTCRKLVIEPLSTWSYEQTSEIHRPTATTDTKKAKSEPANRLTPAPSSTSAAATDKLKPAKKSKNRPSRSALNDLLKLRKQADQQQQQSGSNAKNNLQSFLTQL